MCTPGDKVNLVNFRPKFEIVDVRRRGPDAVEKKGEESRETVPLLFISLFLLFPSSCLMSYYSYFLVLQCCLLLHFPPGNETQEYIVHTCRGMGWALHKLSMGGYQHSGRLARA
jgi:hypothetical protein